jgi:hypothetical protein
MKHITRIERKHSGYGWLVRYRGKSKWFADARYGDTIKSQQAARFHLAELKKKYPAPKTSTGIPGVIKAAARSGDKRWPCFVVQVKSAGIYKSFYVHHYASEQEALAEAKSYRRQVERELARKASDPEETQIL